MTGGMLESSVYLVSERGNLVRVQDHLPEQADEQRASSLSQNNWTLRTISSN